jgi:hypothetical protein
MLRNFKKVDTATMKRLILFASAGLCLSCHGQGLLNRLQKTVEAVDAAKNVLAPIAPDAAIRAHGDINIEYDQTE